MGLVDFLKLVVPQGWFLFYRDFQFRYGLTLLGYFWSVVRPIATAVPLIFVGKQFNLGPEESRIPYEVYALTGVVLWNVFWDAATQPMFLMHRTRTALKRVPVHDCSLVVAVLVATLLNLAVSTLVVSVAVLWFGVSLSHLFWLSIVTLPALALAGLAVGLPLVSVTAVYHDMRYGIGFLGQVLFWSAPVLHQIPESGKLRWINTFNPLTYLIEAGRAALFQPAIPHGALFLGALAVTLAGFFLSFWYYKATIRLAYDYVV